MIYKSLIKDFFYEDSGSTSLSYYLTCSGETIYTGKAYNPKGIKINICKLIEDWLWNDMPDFRQYNGVVVTHGDACKVFNLYDDEGTLLEEYTVLLSYEDWVGENIVSNEPIDGKADPRQKIFISAVESAGTSFDVYGWERLRVTFDEALVFPYNGGTFEIGYEANDGFSVSETCGWYNVSKSVISSGTGYETGTLTFVVSRNLYGERDCYLYLTQNDYVGSVCTQEGAVEEVLVSQLKKPQKWFEIIYGKSEDINTIGGEWRIGYQTNYDRVYYVYNGQTGYTSGGVLVLNIPSGDTEQNYSCYFYDRPGGTLLDTATARRLKEISQYFHITFLEPGSVYWGIEDILPSGSEPSGHKVQYTYDSGATWSNAYGALNAPYEITGNTGDIVYFKATLPGHGLGSSQIYHFYGNTRCNVAGNIMSLEYGDNYSGKTSVANEKQFYGLFKDFTGLCSAAGLVLPATSVKRVTYGSMFSGCVNLVAAPSSIPATSLAQLSHADMFEGCTSLVKAPSLPATSMQQKCYSGMFSGCISLTEAPVLNATSLATGCYMYMFEGCTSLSNPPVLPATRLSNQCYQSMFSHCTSLVNPPELPATALASQCYSFMFEFTPIVTAPELPATTLASSCYTGMFWGCTSLVNAPELPAATMIYSCYYGMFWGCTSLVEAPDLPATKLANYCCSSMFEGCVKLTDVPDLPATTPAERCYDSMFKGCISLVNAPVISAPPIASWCFCSMFEGCTSLRTAPSIPASLYKEIATCACQTMFKDCTRLANSPELLAEEPYGYGCYWGMFEGCTSLVNAPEIKVKNFDNEYSPNTHYSSSYKNMFKGCTSLRTAPELPITGLTDDCYESMFEGCTSLTTAPELPATAISSHYGCYERMFYGCSSLNYVKCLAEDGNSQYCTPDWLYGVAANGTFAKSANMTDWETGASGIPSGWNVVDIA